MNMTTRRMNGDSERLKEITSDSDTDTLGEFDSGKKKKYLVSDSFKDRISRRDIICVVIGGIIVGVAVIAFIILAVVLQSNGKESSTYDNVRLPADLEPVLYDVHLSPNLETLAVTGTVTIKINVVAATNQIILHSKDMTVSSSSLTVNGNLGAIRNTHFVEEHDFLVVDVNQLQTDDDVELRLTFNYTLRDDLVGFYLSAYTNSNGDTVRLATTQFEPTDARRAFPCFDEPAIKANFSISITHPEELTAVSNMPAKPQSRVRRQSAPGFVTTEFETSYRMSTYLIAFVVSDFKCSVPSNIKGRIKVRICASPVVFNSTSYAQAVADDVIGYYEDFFGVDYPLPKQDLFAIPDFAAGAMENWGLITYRETALIYDPSENPASSKQRVAVVIAHELAHQWFGNLVTMEWWDGLWLNEGFASYVEYIGTDHKEKDWKMLEQFFVDTIQTAYQADGLNWSHPILQDVSDPDEINGLFDSISYDKGASLIRMLLNFVTEKTFTEGLANYLKDHKFGNAETSELWSALNDVASSMLPQDLTITEMMDTWTMQMGYPVVTLSSDGKNTFSYKQKRFFLNREPTNGAIAPSPFDYKWVIPFTYIISSNPSDEKTMIIQDRTGSFDVQLSSGMFLKANNKQNGFYRVNYDSANWQAIISHLRSPSYSQVLSGVDRAGLVDDAFALSSAGLLNVTTALDLSLYLEGEREYVPWAASISWLSTVANRLSLTPVYGKLQRYILHLINNTLVEYSFENSNLTHLETFLKSMVLNTAWGAGDMDVAMAAKDLFSAWMKDSSKSIPPNLKRVVYPAGIAFGGEEEWQFLWQRYLNSYDPYEKSLCLVSLSYSKEPWILNRYLTYSLDKVRSQDTLYVIRAVSQNINGRYLAWNFFRDNWDILFKRYGGGSFSFARLIRTLTKSFATEWELKEVESFFEEHSDAGSGNLAVQQSKETIRGNIQWVNENLDVIDKWIDKNILE